ncbi:pantothenate transporter liz1 [Macrophomina phaseolina]|uniref:Pantothenate transporter liz1 n=1 Tax=Macrophomina phaseolina TaxID=35725 RepID=A0ABQ8G9V9_9PEZI|nr:pantothenate transporter liz1 [Macrophomina phaseolina]
MSVKDGKQGNPEHIEAVPTSCPMDGMKHYQELEYSPEEETKLVRKIDLFLLPTIWLMYLLSYMDRTKYVHPPRTTPCRHQAYTMPKSIGNAKIAGMMDDLNLTSNEYSVALVVFFVSYVVFEVPSNMILSRTRPSIFLPALMFLWGAVTCCMAVIHNYHQLVALRFVVGIFEAGFAPGILLILSSWYKKNEQSKRFGIYISAAVLSGAFGGILAGAITKGLHDAHGIAGWRWLFIVEGAATCGWAIISSYLLLDFPDTTKKFSQRERQLAVHRLAEDNVTTRTSEDEQLGSRQAFLQSIRNWRTWLMVVGYMVIVGSSTLSYFYPTLVAGLGYTSHMAQYMVVPIYAVAFLFVGVSAYLLDQHPHHRGLAIAGWLSLSTATSIAVTITTNFTARYILLIFMASGLWSSNALALSYASSTFGRQPPRTRAVSLALVNALGNLAQIYGAYLFPAADAPRYVLGFGVISAMCGVGVAVYIGAHVVVRRWP